MSRFLSVTLILLVGALALPALAAAAEPPNQNDPCSRAGRNTCDTTGVGAYRTYRYGIRWFGDYRGVVAGVDDPLFCVDLRFWYPAKRFGYERRSAAGLKNRDGDAVSADRLRRMAFALWRFGRSTNRTQQGAMMLYVHGLMGDAEPGEAAPDAIGPAVKRRYQAIARAAERLAGPYTVAAAVPDGLTVGQQTTLTVKVTSSTGAAVPDVPVTLDGEGADGLDGNARTDAKGTATLKLTPTTAAGLKVTARAEVAAQQPALYVPTRGEAARSGQRLAGRATATVADTVEAPVRVTPKVVTQVSQQTTVPGAQITDSVQVSGLAGQRVTVNAALYGPAAAADQLKCDATPVWQGSFTADGDGTYATEPVTLQTPGYYTYVEWIDQSDRVTAVKTACGEASETTVVRGTPAITTQISAAETAPGAKISDTAVVSGLGVLAATVNVELWGPYASRDAMTCQGEPAWKGTFTANGDGSYPTEPVTIPGAGYYTYRESIAESPAFAGVQTACGEATETTFAKAAPKVTTIASDAVVKPGAELYDRIKVSGLGTTPATVEVKLYGPYATRADMTCRGAPSWQGTVAVKGDGEVRSPKTKVPRAGFYTYVESIVGSDLVAATEERCRVEAETALAAPLILTGRGDVQVRPSTATTAAAEDDRPTPTRVELARLGIRAPIASADIDLATGALGIPKNIDRVGWWRDGAAPGDDEGTILLAGHVDSAKAGAGAFYALKSTRRGDTVALISDDGATRRWKVTSMRRTRKAHLPTGIFTRTGARRLVLVTCGGPFNEQTGHYRDNIIVVARPA